MIEKLKKFGKALPLRYNCIMKKAASCGTRSGYNRHLRLKEQVCVECRNAQNEYDRKRFNKNPEIKRIRNKKYVNKEKKRAAWRKRDAIIRGAKHEKYSESQVLELYGECCHICNLPIDMTASRKSGIGHNWENGLNIDHLIPISVGGADCLENVRPSHVICNIRKGNKLYPNKYQK